MFAIIFDGLVSAHTTMMMGISISIQPSPSIEMIRNHKTNELLCVCPLNVAILSNPISCRVMPHCVLTNHAVVVWPYYYDSWYHRPNRTCFVVNKHCYYCCCWLVVVKPKRRRRKSTRRRLHRKIYSCKLLSFKQIKSLGD